MAQCGARNLNGSAFRSSRSGSAEVGVPGQGELAGAGARAEVDPVELHPDQAGAGGVLEVVDPVLLVRDRAPDGGRDVGLARRADAAGDADVAHDAEDGGDGLARIGGLGGRVDVDTRRGRSGRRRGWCPAASTVPPICFQYSFSGDLLARRSASWSSPGTACRGG